MIERLQGEITAKGAQGVVLSVGGVGFLLDVSAVTLRDVPTAGEECELFTYLHVREDALQLFGFSTEEERELFRLLLSVSKIGPKLALAALSCRRAPELKKALASGDVALFASIPGIGKKVANRIILELKEKIGAGWAITPEAEVTQENADVLSALTALGYSAAESVKAVASLPADSELKLEDKIKLALQYLGSK